VLTVIRQLPVIWPRLKYWDLPLSDNGCRLSGHLRKHETAVDEGANSSVQPSA